jgi:MoaA/NifB/PqqE/SkfB family radical SAM enzyme
MEAIYRLIKLNRLIKNHRVKFAGVLLWDILGWRHLFVRFDPVNACNLRCGMCYFSDKEYVKRTKGIFKEEEIKRIADQFFPRALQLMVGCGTEPTLHKNFVDVIRLGREHGVPYIGVTTNGQRLTEDQIEKLIEYRLDEITLSVHGVRKETYEALMVNASYERFHEVLGQLDAAKRRHGVQYPAVRMNYTVNEDNLEELADFFEVFGKYDVRTLQIRPMVDVGNTAYEHKDFAPLIPRYRQIIEKLEQECAERGIIFMATVADPTYKSDNKSSYILNSVLRYINPQTVWQPDFRWQTETYREYCKRIGWRRSLFKSIFTAPEKLDRMDQHLTYEVKF